MIDELRKAEKSAKLFAKANGFKCPNVQSIPFLKGLGVFLGNGCIGVNVEKHDNNAWELWNTVFHELGHRWHLLNPNRQRISYALYEQGVTQIKETVAEEFAEFAMGQPTPYHDLFITFGLKEPTSEVLANLPVITRTHPASPIA